MDFEGSDIWDREIHRGLDSFFGFQRLVHQGNKSFRGIFKSKIETVISATAPVIKRSGDEPETNGLASSRCWQAPLRWVAHSFGGLCATLRGMSHTRQL
jgi:hypothetical protein